MAEGSRRVEETPSRVQDWEVVSLTASTYAAAPGPNKPEGSAKENKDKLMVSENQTSAITVNSDHFIFPPKEHEGLPIEQEIGERIENLEISNDANVENTIENLQNSETQSTAEFISENDPKNHIRGKDLNDEEEISENVESLETTYDVKMQSSFENLPGADNLSLQGVELFREKQKQIPSMQGKDGEEHGALKGLDWTEPRQHAAIEEEEVSGLASNLSIFHGNVGVVSSLNTCDEDKSFIQLQKEAHGQAITLPEPLSVSEDEQLERELSSNPTKSPKAPQDEKNGQKDLPCEAWWKRQAASLRAQARQANTLWSIAVAAALMGLVILGHRWQHERWQNQQLRLELCTKDEKISQILYQVARLKEAISGRRKVPIIRSGSSHNGLRDH